MKLLLISCGGTIASCSIHDADKTNRIADEYAAERLIDQVMTPQFSQLLRNRVQYPHTDFIGSIYFTPINLLDLDSTEMVPTKWRVLIECILNNYDMYDGFIITHGINTMAFTSSALAFALPRIGKPVVLTGSYIPSGRTTSDGVINLANAVLTSQKLVASHSKGIFVVFGSRVIPGVRAKKVSETDTESFRTYNANDIGQIRPNETIIWESEYEKYVNPDNGEPSRKNHESPYGGFAANAYELRLSAHLDFNAVISSHTFHPGDEPLTYLAVLKAIAKICLETGRHGAMILRPVCDAGVLIDLQRSVFREAKQLKIPIVVTTQQPQVMSLFTSEKQSNGVELNYNVIPSWDMSIATIVVKMRFLLANNIGYANLQSEFVRNYHGEIRKR